MVVQLLTLFFPERIHIMRDNHYSVRRVHEQENIFIVLHAVSVVPAVQVYFIP